MTVPLQQGRRLNVQQARQVLQFQLLTVQGKPAGRADALPMAFKFVVAFDEPSLYQVFKLHLQGVYSK